MLHESPTKRSKTKRSVKSDNIDTGPTIHELDSEIEITPEELFEGDVGLVSNFCHTSIVHNSYKVLCNCYRYPLI